MRAIPLRAVDVHTLVLKMYSGIIRGALHFSIASASTRLAYWTGRDPYACALRPGLDWDCAMLTGSYSRQLVASETWPHSGPIGDYSWLRLRIGWCPAVSRMCWICNVHVVPMCLTIGGVVNDEVQKFLCFQTICHGPWLRGALGTQDSQVALGSRFDWALTSGNQSAAPRGAKTEWQ
ncbi:hypothetical protein C8J57DRAFT_1227077 [Mycena rebaudengoi]|nr:hypothetical protein C8J57DRAFT_1227077 [Mycena rebaudengoi]